jgi:hypothetical protein
LIGCEHFERPATPPPGVRRGYGTTSTARIAKSENAGLDRKMPFMDGQYLT